MITNSRIHRIVEQLLVPRIELLEAGNMDDFYRSFSASEGIYIGSVTQELIYAGIDVLQGLTEIPDHFLAYSTVQEFKIPSSISIIGCSAFMGSDLRTVVIQSELVHPQAFSNCKSLEDVVLGKELMVISGRSFTSCPNLTDIKYLGTSTKWKEIIISEDAFDNGVRIHCSDGRTITWLENPV